jgi:hypothetical protein
MLTVAACEVAGTAKTLTNTAGTLSSTNMREIQRFMR